MLRTSPIHRGESDVPELRAGPFEFESNREGSFRRPLRLDYPAADFLTTLRIDESDSLAGVNPYSRFQQTAVGADSLSETLNLHAFPVGQFCSDEDCDLKQNPLASPSALGTWFAHELSLPSSGATSAREPASAFPQ